MSTGEPPVFGTLLRRYRAAAHLTQKQLAERVGLSPSALSGVEHGTRRPPTTAAVELLADALSLSGAERTAFQMAADSIDSADASRPIVARVAERIVETHRPSIEWIPIQPTPLVDRIHEVSEIVQVLVGDSVRLLTLVGPAGVGKTRLALAAAQEQLGKYFPDGVIFVDLTPIRVAQDVLGAIARACSVHGHQPASAGPAVGHLLTGPGDIACVGQLRASAACCCGVG